MTNLNFDEERILFTPVVLYADYINLQFNKYLKENYKDFTPRDFTYLVNIFYHQNISQRQLSELLFVSESNVTQIIKRLEKNDYIIREVDDENKSRKIINLTDKGKSTVFSLLKLIFEEEAKFFQQYSDEECDKFKKIIYEYCNNSIIFNNI